MNWTCACIPVAILSGLPAAGGGEAPHVQVRVINAGRPGDTTRDLLARLDRDVLARTPSLVVLMVGTNDALNHAKAVPVREYARNLTALVERLRKAGCRALLTTIPPCIPQYVLERHPAAFFGKSGPQGAVVRYNAVVREVSVQQQVPLVDVYRIFERTGNVGPARESLIRNVANSGARDGVHPTAEGCRVIAAAIYQAVCDHHLPANLVVCLGDSITFGVHLKGAGSVRGQPWPARLARLLAPE